MSDQAPKAKRRWIIIPWAVAIAAVLLWSAWWMISAGQVATRMDTAADGLRKSGYTVSWGARSVSGYPFRYFVKLGEVKVVEPAGWGLTASELDAEASALTPGVIVFAAPNGVGLTRPGKPSLAVTGDVLRMSLSGLSKAPPKLAVQGINLKLVPGTGDVTAFSAIKVFELHLTPGAGDVAQTQFRINDGTPSAGSLLARIAGSKLVTIDIEGAADHASTLQGAGLAGQAHAWAVAGGVLNLTQGGVAIGQDVLISIKPSTLSLDDQGFLKGALTLEGFQPGESLQTLSELGVLPPATAAVASGLAGALPAPAAGQPVAATLDFHDGQAWFGPAPVGEAPRVYDGAPTAPRD